MKIVIVGPPGSGKSTLVRKIINMNESINFDAVIDGIENFPNYMPNLSNMIITCQRIDMVPADILRDSQILCTPDIRGV